MEIKTLKDIQKIDAELAGLFLCSEEDTIKWICAIEHGIKEWIGRHNKQYWEVVRFVSRKRGILGKPSKSKGDFVLTRKEFANAIIKFCPNAVSSIETADALVSSMEQYRYKDALKAFEEQLSASVVRQQVKEVEDILDGLPCQALPEEDKPQDTIYDRLVEFLHYSIDEQINKVPCSKICLRPQYSKIKPAIAIENFATRKFLNLGQPSFYIAFEIVEEKLDSGKLYELIGRYKNVNNTKLYVASTFDMGNDLMSICSENGIGYILVNTKREITESDFILPRAEGELSEWAHNMRIMVGWQPLETPLLIFYDNECATPYLPEILHKDGVTIKKKFLRKVPFISDEDIENKVNTLIQADIDERVKLINLYGTAIGDYSFDPFALANQLGYKINVTKMEGKHRLGGYSMYNHTITLDSDRIDENYYRYRYTMAHELCHSVLHCSMYKQMGFDSVEDFVNSLSVSEQNRKRLEYQANAFAAYFLMPTDIIASLYYTLFLEYATVKYGDKPGPIHYSLTHTYKNDCYHYIVGNISKLLCVSKQAVHNRLDAMKLLIQDD